MHPTDPARQRVVQLSMDVFATLVAITIFLLLSFRIIAPFAGVLIWAIVLAVALAPLHVRLKARLGGRGGPAAAVMAVAGLVLILGPTIVVAEAVAQSAIEWAEHVESGGLRLPPPPDSVRDLPLIGAGLHEAWLEASRDSHALMDRYGPQLRGFALSVVGSGGGLLVGILQFALSVVFAASFLTYAEPLSDFSRRVAGRVSPRGRSMLEMASATIQSVSRGVIGVAFIQGGLAAIGIIVAGLPFAGFLGAAAVMASIVQAPFVVIVPILIYAWSVEPTTFAALLTVYMIPVLLIDNVLKPLLMGRGLKTPMVIILIGVMGGALTSGMIGLFVGPVILALFYEILLAWVTYPDEPEAVAPTAPPGGAPADAPRRPD